MKIYVKFGYAYLWSRRERNFSYTTKKGLCRENLCSLHDALHKLFDFQLFETLFAQLSRCTKQCFLEGGTQRSKSKTIQFLFGEGIIQWCPFIYPRMSKLKWHDKLFFPLSIKCLRRVLSSSAGQAFLPTGRQLNKWRYFWQSTHSLHSISSSIFCNQSLTSSNIFLACSNH